MNKQIEAVDKLKPVVDHLRPPASDYGDEGPPVPTPRRRRGSVSAEADVDLNNRDPIKIVPKSEEIKNLIGTAVKDTFLFKNMDPDTLETVVMAMEEFPVSQGQTVIKQGEDADYMYVITEGIFEVFKDDGEEEKKVFEYRQQGLFGELALMYLVPRQATVRAATDGFLWKVDRLTFRHIMVKTQIDRSKNHAILSTMECLSSIPKSMVSQLADHVSLETYGDKTVIFEQGNSGTDVHYIRKGNVILSHDNGSGQHIEITSLGGGNFIGLTPILKHQDHVVTAIASGLVEIVSFDSASVERLMDPIREELEEQEEKIRNLVQEKLIQKQDSAVMHS